MIRKAPTEQPETERFVIEDGSPIIHYEHVHRYALAARCVEGLRVLDLASGSGYGSRLMRAQGADVVALDLDRRAAQLAAPATCGDATALPFGNESFDAVVCLEAIEHVPEPARVVKEIERVVRRDGIAILSTPERSVYTDRVGNRNPHHLAEMTREEFSALLSDSFAHVSLYGQSVWAGSWISGLDEALQAREPGPRVLDGIIEPQQTQPTGAPRAPWSDPHSPRFPEPLYIVALCARTKKRARALRTRAGDESVLHDPSQRLLGSYFEALDAVDDRQRELDRSSQHSSNLDELTRGRAERITRLEEHADNLAAGLQRSEALLAQTRGHASNLETELDASRAHAADLEVHAGNLAAGVDAGNERSAGLEAHAANQSDELAAGRERVTHLETHAVNLETELVTARERVAQLEAHASNIESQLSIEKDRVSGHEAHGRNLAAELEVVREQVRGLEQHAANLEAQIAERTARVSALEQHVENMERLLEERLGRIGHLEATLEAERARLDALEGRLAESERERESASTELEALRASPWVRALAWAKRID